MSSDKIWNLKKKKMKKEAGIYSTFNIVIEPKNALSTAMNFKITREISRY